MKKMNLMSFIRLSAVVALIATVTVVVAMAVNFGDAVPAGNQGAMPTDVTIEYAPLSDSLNYNSYTSGVDIGGTTQVYFKVVNGSANELTYALSADPAAADGTVATLPGSSTFSTIESGALRVFTLQPQQMYKLYVHDGTEWYSYELRNGAVLQAANPAYSQITAKGANSVTLTVPTSAFVADDAIIKYEAVFADVSTHPFPYEKRVTGTVSGSDVVFTATDIFPDPATVDQLSLMYNVTTANGSKSSYYLPFYGEKATINVGSTPPTKVYDGTTGFDATNVASTSFVSATGGTSAITPANINSILDPTVGFAFDSAAAGTNKTGSFNTAFALNNGFIMVNDPKTTFNDGIIHKRPITFTNGTKALTIEVVFSGSEIDQAKLPLKGFLGTDGLDATDFRLQDVDRDVTTVILKAFAPDAAVTDNYDFANLTVTITKKIADPASPDADSDYAKLQNGNNLAPTDSKTLPEKAEHTGYSMDLGTGHNLHLGTIDFYRLLVTPGLVSADDPASFAIAFNSARSGLGFSTYTTFDMSLVDHDSNVKVDYPTFGIGNVVFFSDAKLTSMGIDISKELTMLHFNDATDTFSSHDMHRVTGGFEVRGLTSLSPFVIYQAPDAVSSNNPAIAPNTGVYFG